MPATGLGSGGAKRGRDSSGGKAGGQGDEASPSKKHAGGAGGKDGEAPFKATIAKIRMKDFLAYEDVEVEPGPELNLIVGPNGSGKSTIVAAICMGLGGSIKIMDRSNEGGFIRRGQSKGSVEIWLNQRGGELMHIKREISASGSSTWYMNGAHKKHADITKFTRDNNIMLDNLCHFMPQEKVQLFSETAGKPEEMLEQVQRAVCPESMLQLHQELKDEQKKSSTLESDHQAATKLLKEQQSKEAQLADEMQRFEQLCVLEEKLRLREKKMPWVKRFQIKERRKDAQEQLKQVDAVFVKARNAYNEKASDLKEKEKIELQAKKAISTFRIEGERAARKIEEIEIQDQDLCQQERSFNQDLKEIDKKVKEQHAKIQKKEQEIADLQQKLATAGPPPKDIDKKIKDASDACRKVNDEHMKVNHELRAKDEQCRHLQHEMTQMQKKLDAFRDPRQIKLQALGGSNQNLKAVRTWLDQNAQQFDKPVWGPIFLELEVENQTDGEMLASALFKHLNTFVVETRKDYDRMHKLMDEDPFMKKYKRFVDVIDSSYCPDWERVNGDIQSLKEHGIEGYLIDRVKGPAPVMNVLCELVVLNRMLVGTTKVWDNCYSYVDRPELVTKGNDNKKRNKICGAGCFVPGKGRVNISYSFYGQQRGNATTTKFHEQDKTRIMPSGGSDKAEFERKFKDAQAKFDAADREKKGIVERQKALGMQKSKSQEELQRLKEERVGAGAIQARLKATERMLREERDKNPAKDKAALTKKRDNVIKDRMDNVAEIVSLAKKSFGARKDGLISELRSMSVLSEVQEIRDRCSELRSSMREADDVVKRHKKDFDAINAEYEEAKLACEELTDEEKVIFREQLTDDLETLEGEITMMKEDKARLGVANNRLRELEQCRAQIKELEVKVGKGGDYMKIHKERMDEMKSRWLDGEDGKPGLREIIGKVDRAFSQMFEEMGNTGQVRLNEAKIGDEDDFVHYSLEILVMFRNAEVGGGRMNPLNGKLQSGGERSLTIMLFLISLQQMTQCPFRVVDEINQGMDIHNEKWVFDYVVEHNCKRHKSQFFLITPKLQANLLQEMKDHITVLCVFKGKHMIPSGDWVRHGMLATA